MQIQRLTGETIASIPEQCAIINESVMFNCATKEAPVSAELPSIKSMRTGWVDVNFFDSDRNSGKNNVTIKPAEGDRINGSTEGIVLNKNGAGAMLKIFGMNDWKCIVCE
jgi:hypothetical protein